MKKRNPKQSRLDGEVEMGTENGGVGNSEVHQPREGWAEAFGEIARWGDDQLLDDVAPSLSTWDETEWEW